MKPVASRLYVASRNGFSLLEVLVACGILVIGLSSIAAILPAASARLREAALQDRAVSAIGVAFSEVRCRSLADRDMFPSSFTPTPAIVFGETLSLAAGYDTSLALPASAITISSTGLRSGSTFILAPPVAARLSARINSDIVSNGRRGFLLEDDLRYGTPGIGSLPLNSFVDGVREFRRDVCWGAMVTPIPWRAPAAEMTAAKVSVAVFRKAGSARVITLSGTQGGIFRTTSAVAPASLQRTLLRPCGAVLAIPPESATVPPQWLSIRSSWLQPNSTMTCVVFASPLPTQLMISGTTLTVIGYEHLLRVSEQVVSVP